ncbi:MAG: prepilin-type N-terminal cleavage/methylation domain-containing protein [Patescibacteria group bacterium]
MSPVRKRGFTFIEVAITTAIIVMMALAAIPAMEDYGQKNRFDNRAAEIESLAAQAITRAKNPEKDVESYRLVPDAAGGTIELTNNLSQVVGAINLGENESVAGNYRLECLSPGQICQLRDALDNVVRPTESTVIFIYSDTKINKNVSYSIVPDPWRIIIQK